MNGKFVQDEFSTDEAVIAVIIHEIIHTCEGCWNHGEKFMEYGQRITEKYGIKVAASDSAENLTIDSIAWEKSFRYVIECNGCGQTVGKNRMCDLIRYPQLYKCGICGGKMKRTK